MQQEFQQKKEQYVHNVEINYRYPIYGYHKDKKPFLKIELYDPRNVKKCQSILQQGLIMGGMSLQPYESHLSYFMHFYGDYNLSGMEYVKITEFYIRHLVTYDRDSKQAILKSKSSYQIDKFKQASQVSDQSIDETIQVQSMASNQSQFPGFRTSKPKDQVDYSFLQNDNYLRLWHSEMSEIQEDTELLISPYPRVSSCEVELDCSCKDILNIWESDKSIIGSASNRQQSSDHFLRKSHESMSESFLDNYITPFKTQQTPKMQQMMNSEEEQKSGRLPFNMRCLNSQQSIRTVTNDEQLMMQVPVEPSGLQSNQKIIEFSKGQLARMNSLKQSSNKSFSFTQGKEVGSPFMLNKPIDDAGLSTPQFKLNSVSNVTFDEEFGQYAEDIKEVRSLVNLWKEEFIRRKTTPGLPPLEKAVMSDGARSGGFSESILSRDIVMTSLHKHLVQTCPDINFSHVTNDIYQHLELINFNVLKALLTQREQQFEEDGSQQRYEMLGFGSMKQLHDARHGKAVLKNIQQEVDEEDADANIDVLDIMDSLKDQFEGLQEKNKAYKEGKAKYRTGKLANDVQNNKSIFDYMSPRQSKQQNENPKTPGLESSCEQEQSNQLIDIQDSLLSLQFSDIKQKQTDGMLLEEVKEECDSYSSEIPSPIPEIINEVRHVLKGDKIRRIKSPPSKLTNSYDFQHQKAFFSKKEDLLQHWNDVKRMRNDKRIQLSELKVGFSQRVRQELELDYDRDLLYDKISQVTQCELIFRKSAPTNLAIINKYKEKLKTEQYELKLCNLTETNQEVKDKVAIKKDIIKANANHRFVTPSTQYELKFLDSQVNMGGFEKKREISNPNKLSLFDVHKQFDKIFGLTIMAVEIFVQARVGCVPNYEHDQISAIYFTIHDECAELDLDGKYDKLNGVIFNTSISPKVSESGSYHALTHVIKVNNEIKLFQEFISVVRLYDPDILVGYETETQSIGYICKRAETFTIQMASMLSRIPNSLKSLNESFYLQRILMRQNDIGSADDQQPSTKDQRKNFGYFQQKWGQAVKIIGRVVLNLWRLITSEINLTNYDLDNVCFHILKKREPRFDYDTLSKWWMKGQFYHVTNYTMKKLHNLFSILDTMNFIHRDINMANVYGIDYESIMTRGTQFRVEAILSRISKSQGFLLLSASPQQVFGQNELEVIPLVIEPDKLFYTDPVIIVDFQSLYPSLIIAYNLCYSTCLGKIQTTNSTHRQLGVTTIPGNIKTFFGFKSDEELTQDQERFIFDNIIVAPNLNCFVKPHIREGLLPRMLKEILNTRIMVKKSMKLYKSGSPIYRMLDSRQLALKLISNVTYGYTAAGFSGRMPCSEMADSVVSLGRITIEKAIEIINLNEDSEGTRIVYGDTDSLFILCKGRTLEQAFKIGEKIAKHITSINPFPMELKFEKVYYPCVTLAKKRYCGYKMEKITDERILDAKGIETIRRDNVDAVQKIMDKSLRLLFETKDLSQVKSYLIRQWGKIVQGNVDFKDFIFAKEVKYGMYRSKPPGALVVDRRVELDPGALPRFRERIPYVVVLGQGGTYDQSKLKDLVLSPEEFLARDGLLLNHAYYIKKQINPALNRLFLELFDIDVNSWFDQMPKVVRENGAQSKKVNFFASKANTSKSVVSQSKLSSSSSIAGQNSMMIDQFYSKKNCQVCGSDETSSLNKLLCKHCSQNIPQTIFIMESRLKNINVRIEEVNSICLSCSNMLLKGRVAAMIDIEDTGPLNTVPCVSYQCKVFYEKLATYKEHSYLRDIIQKLDLF